MTKFTHGIWPLPQPSIHYEKSETDSRPRLHEITDEEREAAKGLSNSLARLTRGDKISKNGPDTVRYKAFIDRKGWEILADEEDILKIYIPPTEEIDTRDLDRLNFRANRQLHIYRDRIISS